MSPKVLIVLRKNWLQPLPSDPLFDELGSHFQQLVTQNCSIYSDTVSARFWLVDLPVGRRRPSYPVLQNIDELRRLAQSNLKLFSDDDTFDFKLLTLPTSQSAED